MPNSPSLQTCPLCDGFAHVTQSGQDLWLTDCALCRRFEIDDAALSSLRTQDLAGKRYVLSAASRRAAEANRVLRIEGSRIESLIEDVIAPKSPIDVADQVLLHIAGKVVNFAVPEPINQADYTLFVLKSIDEFATVIRMIEELGWVRREYDHDWNPKLTAKGWQHVGDLRDKKPLTRQAFVAMSFAPDLKSAYTDGIRPALRETGYSPIRIDELQHNEKIDDKIVAELRRSGLLIADFTGHRGGVYFEAGYGLGRGIPVIWSCRLDEVEKAHFDTRQFNHLTWTTPEDLREKLRNRIRATLETYPPLE
jgi:nucleoside 2-deoxyribosyltransferase